MLAIVCPGQGAQKPGFLSPWLELPGVEDALSALSEAGGVDLLRHGTESDADTIRDTAVAQPLLVAAGILAAAGLYQEQALPAPDMVAGHSVGELTAAALGGVLSNGDAMRLVAARSQAMATAAAAEPTSMAAVVGGTREDVLAAIERHGLHPANLNSAAQVVAAGASERIAALAEDGPAKARVIPLQVAGAFHTPYMASARSALAEFAPTLTPTDPAVPLLSNAGGEVVTSGGRYLELIVEQVASPVDWESCMAGMRERGVTAMLEVAPAGTLTGLAKRELKGISLANLNTPDDLEQARALVREHAGRTDQEN
ncbi:ACP S-malonyltransferase [Brachybacterium saurashtrense]|uniref:Malonyl CoA-acyl carrier protein transacylase n=1 Tax=Brachybacterium saurashtrense TaxID=556288 RepID=A0A345YMN2_9MICO|nr:ACP S-malonyltransferase [Brachybacterium saurashtrense]AXK45184.1 ACP S-malonyltransferase [Brachybacterium saurashtrense]RRR22062.1 ACP S-malonyltransferase [Brachybacterium saurashtrense]